MHNRTLPLPENGEFSMERNGYGNSPSLLLLLEK